MSRSPKEYPKLSDKDDTMCEERQPGASWQKPRGLTHLDEDVHGNSGKEIHERKLENGGPNARFSHEASAKYTSERVIK
jgi:hypothetical protein